jgi:hypothetical protein
MGTLLHQGTQLAYLHHRHSAQLSREQAYDEAVFDGSLMSDMRHLQEEFPPGETILAWTATPFLLDYHRDNIIDVNIAGMDQLWGRIPQLRYVAWQYKGLGVFSERALMLAANFGRRIGHANARAIDVMHYLRKVVPLSKKLDDRDGVILIRIDNQSPPPPN